jgi:hypothetical protein
LKNIKHERKIKPKKRPTLSKKRPQNLWKRQNKLG